MELHERVRSKLPVWALAGCPCPSSITVPHLQTQIQHWEAFSPPHGTSEPALLSLTQLCGAADSVLQPLDGYLLLFITVSAPREHQSQFCFFCAAFLAAGGSVRRQKQRVREISGRFKLPFLFYTYPRVLWKPFHNIKVKEQSQPRSI